MIGQSSDQDALEAGMPSNSRDDLEAAERLHGQPMSDPVELRPLTEALAELKETVQAAIQAGMDEPADIVEDKCRQAREDVTGEALAWLTRGQLSAILETCYGQELLPHGEYWARPDGSATVPANRVLATGVASSNLHRRTGGTVKIRRGEFDVLARAYIAASGLNLDLLPERFRFRANVENRLHAAPHDGQPAQAVAPDRPSGIRTNRAAEAEQACDRWIGDLKERPTNMNDAFEAARVALGKNLSRKAFDRAWARTAPDEWKMSGRRKRSESG